MARDALEEQIVKETREANYDDFNEYWVSKNSCITVSSFWRITRN